MTGAARQPLPTIALLMWGDSFDDFLDGIGLDFAKFRDEMTGGWAFGYVQALATAGMRTVIVCVSHRVRAPERHRHAPTGAVILVLPAPAAYRQLRRHMRRPAAWGAQEMFGTADVSLARRIGAGVLHDASPYLATPPWQLVRALRREGCCALLTQEYEDPRFDHAIAVGALSRLPVFATFQGGDGARRSRLESLLRPVTLRAAAGLIIGSSREADRVQARYGVAATRIARVFNPLDLERWQPIPREQARRALQLPAEARVAVWHGRVDIRRKGLDILLQAWARLRDRAPAEPQRLLLVGTGADAAELRQRLTGVADVSWRDEYLLDRSTLRLYLSAADVAVLSSRHEGFPVAPLEAMACGTGIVATAVPGVVDILERGEQSGGLIVPVGDVPALADALAAVLGDPERSAVLGERARARVQRAFALEVVGGRLRSFITARGGCRHPVA